MILALGVRPDTTLAKMAGIEIGERGGIRVDEHMRTSDPDIFAVGDAVEVQGLRHRRVEPDRARRAGEPAGPHRGRGDRRARLALPRHPGHRDRRALRRRRSPGPAPTRRRSSGSATPTSRRSTSIRTRTPGYYPGAKPIAMKVLFRKSDGRVLGAQAVGEDGVDKRISELALAIQLGATVYDLEEVELCYAPPFGSAKDPINFAGMVAAGVLRGDMPVSHWDAVQRRVPPRRAREGRARGGAGAGRGQHPARSSCARASTSCPATARSSSSAAPASAPTTRRAASCRTGSTPESSPEACCRTRSSRRRDRQIRRVTRAHDRQDRGAGGRRRRRGLHDRADPARRRGPVGRPPRRAAAGRHPGRTRLPRPGRRRRLAWSRVRIYQLPGTVGAIAPIEGDDGWLLAAGRGFVHLSPDGSLRTSPRLRRPEPG